MLFRKKFYSHKKIGWILFLLSPIIGIFLIELNVRDSVDSIINWIITYQKIYLFTVIIFLGVQALLLALLNNIYFSILLTHLIFFLMAIINKYKLELMDSPFLPWDIVFTNQIISLLPALYKSVNIVAIVGVILIFLIIFNLIIKKMEFNALRIKIRVIIGSISVLFLVMLSNYYGNFFKPVLDEMGIVRNQTDQKVNQETNGLILGFVLNIPSALVSKPSNYSQDFVEKDIDLIQSMSYEISNLKPNIIVIMSEAFWELENLGVFYNGKTLNPTVSQNKIGYLISSNYGGGTSNIEFEVLTGLSMNNLPFGSIAYQQYIRKDLPSLPRTLIDKGYNTIALHTYNKEFWNRNEVYEFLGFEKFIGLEDLENPQYNGLFVDDIIINELILDEIKNNSKPSFIYAITMQNHGGYQDNRYNENTLKITNNFTAESNQIINTYGTGINYSDKLLSKLIDNLNKIGKPTLIVFFGDHLPALGNVYTESEYVSDMSFKTLEEEIKLKQTPLVVWNNYDKSINKIENISAAFLSSKIFEWSEIERPLFYDFLDDFHSKMPGYTSLVKMDEHGGLSIETPQKYKTEDDIYKRIQYDTLFGEEYYRNHLFYTK